MSALSVGFVEGLHSLGVLLAGVRLRASSLLQCFSVNIGRGYVSRAPATHLAITQKVFLFYTPTEVSLFLVADVGHLLIGMVGRGRHTGNHSSVQVPRCRYLNQFSLVFEPDFETLPNPKTTVRIISAYGIIPDIRRGACLVRIVLFLEASSILT